MQMCSNESGRLRQNEIVWPRTFIESKSTEDTSETSQVATLMQWDRFSSWRKLVNPLAECSTKNQFLWRKIKTQRIIFQLGQKEEFAVNYECLTA